MTATTRVLEVVAPMQMAWQERPVAVPPSGSAVIRPLLVGVCGTDLEIIRGVYPRVSFPAVIGHEWVGEVVGPVPGGPAAGTLVVGYNRSDLPDGRVGELGFESPGALADALAVPVGNLVPVSASVPPEDVVLAEPTAVVMHAVARIPRAGESTVIYGDGPIGLIAALILREAGHRVTVVGRRPARLERLRELGFRALPVSESETVLAVDTIDTIVEASGNPDAVDQALRLIAPGGLLSLLGAYLGTSIGEFGLIGDKNLRIEGVNTGDGYLSDAVDCIARGVVTADKVGVSTVDRHAAASAIPALANRERDDMKLVIDLREDG